MKKTIIEDILPDIVMADNEQIMPLNLYSVALTEYKNYYR